MIKVKVTKNIIRDGTIFLNLTKKQVLFALLAIGAGLGTYFGLRSRINFDFLMTIVFMEIVLIIGIGVVHIQGMSIFMIIVRALKGTDKRPYYTEGVFNSNETKT